MKEIKTQIQALRGTKDLLPEEARLWTALEEKARKGFACFGFSEMRTPIIEESSLFVRSIGQGTDIVEKQMYTFLDRGERSISLRPEATASVVRAYLEHGMDKNTGLAKLFYIGPMFRAERPQAGRARQFHQIGVEAIGSYNPNLDAEVIALLVAILDSFNVVGYKIKLNSLGCTNDKNNLSAGLRKSLEGKINDFCDDCKVRYDKNVLRVLDCKEERCKNAIRKIFQGTEAYLCPECKTHFDSVRSALDILRVDYQIEPHLVRGLDYYTKTTFEVTHHKLGAQDAIAAGGRYDNLVSDLGGPEKGACGFAIGMERAAMAIHDIPTGKEGIDIFIATIGDEAYRLGFRLVMELRKVGISADIDYEGRSLKAQMRAADKIGARLAALIGGDEIKNHSITVRNMHTKEQSSIPERSFVSEIERMLAK
ncbi:MAG: histidine--tRNA ligase [Candidatus Omnitrophota bacterium]|nr:histidine--tRNA ligase [Candidatus Omnitrophota bacterium]